MAEYSANAVQTVAPGETAIFTESENPCRRGFVRHREGTGSFLLNGWVPRRSCGCRANSAIYTCFFQANIAVPEGETVGPISIAITVDGATVPATTMISTPAAVGQFNSVSVAKEVDVWCGCCETLAIRNTSSIPILVQNANLIIRRDDLNVTM